MAKLDSGICGNLRGTVGDFQYQRLHGETVIRTKQPTLGAGTAAQTEYRKRFAYINKEMAEPSNDLGNLAKYSSPVEKDNRSACLKQSLKDFARTPADGICLTLDESFWSLFNITCSKESSRLANYEVHILDPELPETSCAGQLFYYKNKELIKSVFAFNFSDKAPRLSFFIDMLQKDVICDFCLVYLRAITSGTTPKKGASMGIIYASKLNQLVKGNKVHDLESF